MIKKAKPISSELIIKYAHKISTEFGVCCPQNWTPDNPVRPYPTDADMRRGWLGKINDLCTMPVIDEGEAQRTALKVNSKGNYYIFCIKIVYGAIFKKISMKPLWFQTEYPFDAYEKVDNINPYRDHYFWLLINYLTLEPTGKTNVKLRHFEVRF